MNVMNMMNDECTPRGSATRPERSFAGWQENYDNIINNIMSIIIIMNITNHIWVEPIYYSLSQKIRQQHP